MKHLTIIERKVLELIPRGTESKAKTAYISNIIGLSVREVNAVVYSLRRKGVPVLAKRGFDSGLYIAMNQEELATGLMAFKSQQNSMAETIELLEKANVNDWHKYIA